MNPTTLSRGMCASRAASSSVRTFASSSQHLAPKSTGSSTSRKAAKPAPAAAAGSAAPAAPAEAAKAATPVKRKERPGVPRHVLRDLVSLHHTAASFLHDPKDVAVGFENAFQHTANEPTFLPYGRWRDDIQRTVGEGSKMIPRTSPDALDTDYQDRRMRVRSATKHYTTFKPHNSVWSQGRDEGRAQLSDRELQVQEALFGSWERGGLGMRGIEPGLDGVEEWLEAKGKTMKQYAREWESRHDEAPDLGNVIEGQEVRGIEAPEKQAE